MVVREGAPAERAVSLNPRLFRLDPSAGGRPVLVGGRCAECGCHFFPSRAICPACGRAGLETVDLSPRGRIWTFTIAHQVPPGAVVEAPYAIAQVELPERVLVSALIRDCALEEVRVGQEVEITPMKVREDEEGRDVVAFAFRPVDEPKVRKS